jgi:hypothetical protein
MAAGIYSGLVEREDRIRTRKNIIADKKAANEEWNARFKLQNEEANRTWLERNKITNQQAMTAAERAAAIAAGVRLETREYQAGLTEEEREYQAGLTADERRYQATQRVLDQNWWREQKDYDFKLSEQSAINDQGRLEAFDQKKFERDREERKRLLIAETSFKNEAERKEFLFRFNLQTEAAQEAAVAKHASEMQQILVEKVTAGAAIGTDFNSAVSGSSNPMSKIAQYSAGIIALGVKEDNPVLAKLAGLNNPAVMKSTFETLQKYHTKIGETGRNNPAALEMFRNGANDFLSGIVITSPDPSQAEAIIKQLESMEGARPLDELTKSLIQRSSNTGSAVATIEPPFIEQLDISKLGPWKEVITQNAVARGRSEQNSISKALTSVNEMSKTGTPEQQAKAKELMDWLGKRSLAVTEALDSAKGDTPDYFGIASLYGNNVIGEAMEAEPKLRTAVLPDYLKEAKDAEPIVVPNVSVLRSLIEYGIIKVGDVVTYTKDDGKTVTGPYKGR